MSDGSLRRDGRSNGSTVLGVERAALDASLGILEQLVEVGALEGVSAVPASSFWFGVSLMPACVPAQPV